MLYTKEYLTGRDIDLSKYNLGVIRQIRIDEFMIGYDYELSDFVKPFYLEQSLGLNEDISSNKVHFTYFYALSQQDENIMQELIKSLIFLYDLKIKKNKDGTLKNIKEHISIANVNNDLFLIIKKDDQPYAFINDENFNILSQVVLEMCQFDKPQPEQKPKGDPELIEKMNKRRREYEKKHARKNSMLFEEMVRQVMYIRKITYDEIKNWTIWQVKNVFVAECLLENSDKTYLLATNPYAGIDLSKNKNWKNETKLARE